MGYKGPADAHDAYDACRLSLAMLAHCLFLSLSRISMRCRGPADAHDSCSLLLFGSGDAWP